MKIERVVVYSPTIYHGYLLENIVILGAASHGLHCRLWSVRGRSAQWSALTGPWATPPIAGATKIERGWMYYPTIHHGNFLLNKLSSWRPPAMASTAAYEPSTALPLKDTC